MFIGRREYPILIPEKKMKGVGSGPSYIHFGIRIRPRERNHFALLQYMNEGEVIFAGESSNIDEIADLMKKILKGLGI